MKEIRINERTRSAEPPIANGIQDFAPAQKNPTSIYILLVLLRRASFCRNPRNNLQAPLSVAKMKVIAAYLLAVLGGNTSPTADDLKSILGSVGAEADDEKIELLLSEVCGKDITELIAAGREKLASVPCGGGAVAVAPAAGGAAGGGAAPPPEAKEEKKVEEKEESDDDMGFSLFD
ncbi:hypothetical protein L6164_022095 [Bauhinia variegata]|uniref:Uncharacterized protein n=1 Tax=Bauhinia variegata TaxID=167791 RepID=A0ACB9MDZ0_BAUVA|nr:hypothetical protein L6164_022095 [Bauhinia variegata]